MKALITGITGFVGSHLAEYLLKQPQPLELIGLARWRSPLDNLRAIRAKINLCYGDLVDGMSLTRIDRKSVV